MLIDLLRGLHSIERLVPSNILVSSLMNFEFGWFTPLRRALAFCPSILLNVDKYRVSPYAVISADSFRPFRRWPYQHAVSYHMHLSETIFRKFYDYTAKFYYIILHNKSDQLISHAYTNNTL
jgi:hypothetical protein